MIRSCLPLAFAISVCIAPAHAAPPPKQLFNKTITVAFALTSAGAPGSLQVQRKIYVSEKGRIFVRGQRTTGNASDSNDVALGTYQYNNGKITGFYTMAQHANQLTITFDPSFQSCDATLVFGKAAGGEYRTTAPNGVTTVNSAPPMASKPSCAISEGNPFPQG